MAKTAMRFADFVPQTKLSAADFDELERAGGISLSPDRRTAIERSLQEYEFLRHLKSASEGRRTKDRVIQLPQKVEELLKLINEVENDAGHLWPYACASQGIDSDDALRFLGRLHAGVKELRGKVPRRRQADHLLPALLRRLESHFRMAGGGSTGVCRDKDYKRSGHFLAFAYAAARRLPAGYRPASKESLGKRWERIYADRNKNRIKPNIWIGGPHPFAAKS